MAQVGGSSVAKVVNDEAYFNMPRRRIGELSNNRGARGKQNKLKCTIPLRVRPHVLHEQLHIARRLVQRRERLRRIHVNMHRETL
jgi:hypothetical protein